jgi:tRNA(Ile)-lysidine synthetase-like protein
MNQLLDILESDKPNAEMELSSGYLAQRSYDSFVMTINSPKETLSESILITHEGEWRYKDTIFTVSTNKPNIISGICLELWYNNLDLIFPLTVRNRVDGDKIITASGTKKIKDLFIDKKIPLKDRDSILIVTDANHQIIWIPEIRTASSIKNGDKVLYLTYKRGQSC